MLPLYLVACTALIIKLDPLQVMEDVFRSATEHVLARCAADVDLFHKHVTPGHRVSHEGHSFNLLLNLPTFSYQP